MLNLRERGTCFVASPHLTKDVREQEILPRLIGLSRHGAALNLAGLFEFVLSNAHQGHQIERLRIVDIEHAGMPKGFFGPRQIAQFQKEAAQRDRCAGMPPMTANEILHDWKRSRGTFNFAVIS